MSQQSRVVINLITSEEETASEVFELEFEQDPVSLSDLEESRPILPARAGGRPNNGYYFLPNGQYDYAALARDGITIDELLTFPEFFQHPTPAELQNMVFSASDADVEIPSDMDLASDSDEGSEAEATIEAALDAADLLEEDQPTQSDREFVSEVSDSGSESFIPGETSASEPIPTEDDQ